MCDAHTNNCGGGTATATAFYACRALSFNISCAQNGPSRMWQDEGRNRNGIDKGGDFGREAISVKCA